MMVHLRYYYWPFGSFEMRDTFTSTKGRINVLIYSRIEVTHDLRTSNVILKITTRLCHDTFFIMLYITMYHEDNTVIIVDAFCPF